MAKQECDSILKKIKENSKDYYQNVIVVEGDKTEGFGTVEIITEVLNPIIESMPCPLPGSPPQSKRNLGFGIGVIGLTQKFTCYSFADKEMFFLAKEKITDRGYELESLELSSPS